MYARGDSSGIHESCHLTAGRLPKKTELGSNTTSVINTGHTHFSMKFMIKMLTTYTNDMNIIVKTSIANNGILRA